MKAAKTILTLLLLISSRAYSSPCDEKNGIAAREYQKMVQFQAQINQLNLEIPQLDQDLQRAKTAMPGYEDSVKLCTIYESKINVDVETLGLAIETFNKVIVFDHTLRRRLLEIIENGYDAPDWSLSAALKNYVEKYSVDLDQRLEIVSIAKALDLLIEKDKNWKIEERQWLEKVKIDNSAIEDLAARFQRLYDDKVSKDKNLDDSCQRSIGQAALLRQQIANAFKRKTEIAIDVAGLRTALAEATAIRDANSGCIEPSYFQRWQR